MGWSTPAEAWPSGHQLLRPGALLLASIAWLSFATPARAASDCRDCHADRPASDRASPLPRARRVFRPGATGISETCLACHDGSRASAAAHPEDHPVMVDYERARFRRSLFLRASSEPSSLGGSIAEDLLVDGRVECTSCHDPHGGHGTGVVALRIVDRRSALCKACHDI